MIFWDFIYFQKWPAGNIHRGKRSASVDIRQLQYGKRNLFWSVSNSLVVTGKRAVLLIILDTVFIFY